MLLLKKVQAHLTLNMCKEYPVQFTWLKVNSHCILKNWCIWVNNIQYLNVWLILCNVFFPSITYLHLLKTSENHKVSFSSGYRNVTSEGNGLMPFIYIKYIYIINIYIYISFDIYIKNIYILKIYIYINNIYIYIFWYIY